MLLHKAGSKSCDGRRPQDPSIPNDKVALLAVQNPGLACILNCNWRRYSVEKLPEEFKLFTSHELSAHKGCQSYCYCGKD